MNRINAIVRFYTCDEDLPILDLHFPPEQLYLTAYELSRKLLTLSSDLLPEYYSHPLYPRHVETNRLVCHFHFLKRVKLFHETVRRPSGTYDIDSYDDPRIVSLTQIDREICPLCGSSRQLYCGDCGTPLATAIPYLPAPIELPFNILLLIHW